MACTGDDKTPGIVAADWPDTGAGAADNCAGKPVRVVVVNCEGEPIGCPGNCDCPAYCGGVGARDAVCPWG